MRGLRRRERVVDREDRLRERIRGEEKGVGTWQLGEAPLGRLDWSAVRDAVGSQVLVVIDESMKLALGWVRYAVAPQLLGLQSRSPKHGGPGPRYDLGPARPPP